MRNYSIQRMAANGNCLLMPLALSAGNAFVTTINSMKRKKPPCVEQAADMLLSELRYGPKELRPRARGYALSTPTALKSALSRSTFHLRSKETLRTFAVTSGHCWLWAGLGPATCRSQTCRVLALVLVRA